MKKLKITDLVVFENDDYLVLNKPAGIASLHERTGINESVIEALRRYNPDYQLCHRLDKETSGALLVSKHSDAYRNAAIQFEKRKVRKTYRAVCEGVHRFEDYIIDLPLATTRSGRSSINRHKGKPSKTIVNTVEVYGHYTLVSCEPESGRLHQIRIHLASHKAPIACDTIYGGSEPYLSRFKRNFSVKQKTEEQPMIQRFALHAYSLSFEGMNNEAIEVIADYPKDFAVLVKLLKKYDTYH